MDLSKLPRLSETHKQTPPQPQVPTPAPVMSPLPSPATGAGIGAQVWLSAVFGVLLVAMGWNFARFCIAEITGQPFHTNVTWTAGDNAGQEVEYFQLQGYTAYSEMAIFVFGVAMVLEAVLLATVRTNTATTRALVSVALLVTIVATALNLVVCALLFRIGTLPLMSGLAVAYGGYIATYEWQVLRQFQSEARA